MPKFDVIVGNPPYQRSLHLYFLEKIYDVATEYILWIHPSVWLLDEKGKTERYKKTKKLIENTLEQAIFINANPIFNVGIFSPFVIDVINKNKKDKQILVTDKINNSTYVCDSIHKINKWADLKIYPTLKEKIMTLARKDSLDNHKNRSGGRYFVNIAAIRGHIDDIKMKNDDFYSLVTKRDKPSSDIEKPIYFSFKSETEATNLVYFLKTRWAMFAASIYKIDQNITLESIPWLDFNQEWTEEKFEKFIDASDEEKEFVYKNIPKYYD